MTHRVVHFDVYCEGPPDARHERFVSKRIRSFVVTEAGVTPPQLIRRPRDGDGLIGDHVMTPQVEDEISAEIERSYGENVPETRMRWEFRCDICRTPRVIVREEKLWPIATTLIANDTYEISLPFLSTLLRDIASR